MGIFDVPALLFVWLDARAGFLLPPVIRLILWGGTAGLVTMMLYRWLSAQGSIRRGKQELKTAQRALNSFDGELADAWALMARVVRLALCQVGRVGKPSVAASVPLLCLLSWLSHTYGYAFPQSGTAPVIRTEPAQLNARWIGPRQAGENKHPRIVVADGGNRIVADLELAAPVAVIHKRKWWNRLIGNPGGYLAEHGPIERIAVQLPRRQYLHLGPDWARGWEPPFFATLLAVSVLLKATLRIA
jgi:hypothetical protein